jgi:hypothetical protein
MDMFIQFAPERQRQLCQAAGDSIGLDATSIEKDFWVCWTLRELFSLPGSGRFLTFKGVHHCRRDGNSSSDFPKTSMLSLIETSSDSVEITRRIERRAESKRRHVLKVSETGVRGTFVRYSSPLLIGASMNACLAAQNGNLKAILPT